MKLKNKIIKAAVMVVAVCGITFAFQTNTYAKKNFKVTPSKVEKQSKKSFRTITTKYTKHYLVEPDRVTRLSGRFPPVCRAR